MRKKSEDKAERILSIYSRLKMGKVIFKEKESNDFGVATRTIQRDIADIQCFLQNQTMESGELQEIIFDKKAGGYILQTKQNSQLEGKEILTVTKVLLESRSLMKSELFPIIHKLIGLCSDENEAKLVEDLLKNEMHHYVELMHGKFLLEELWKLELAVKKQKYIKVQYKKIKNQEVVTRRLKPVGIVFAEFYFYLIAFIEGKDENTYPAFYRIDRLQTTVIEEESFCIPYAERFEEGEFRKRIQFMHGGELRKIQLLCNEKSIEAVLDRLPTAEVIQKEGDQFLIKAEVFGNGIDMWLKGQEDVCEKFNI